MYNDQKYFTRRYKILGYLISAYPKANQNKLSKQLRKFKYFSQDFLLVLFAVFYAILFFGTTFIFHGIGKNGILIFFENFLFPLIATVLSWFITMVIITITEK